MRHARLALGLAIPYGIMHAAVDAASVTAIYAALDVHRLGMPEAFTFVLIYDLLAFATQILFGAASDKLACPRLAAVVGLGLVAGGALTLPLAAVPTLVLVGLGNACFHVGGGAIALRIAPRRAWAPGLFVAPGALGLAFGVWFGKSGHAVLWPFALGLALAVGVALLLPSPPHPNDLRSDPVLGPELASERARIRYPLLAVTLLLVSVFIRSLIGFAGGFALPKAPSVMLALGTAAFAGKALGGLLADRLGWVETSVGALLLSAPLIAFGGSSPTVVVAGMFLFQMTMPATLAGLALAMPRRPGLAFGLACLALIAGAVPTFYPWLRPLYGPVSFLVAVAISAVAVGYGLRLLGGRSSVVGVLGRRPLAPARAVD